jgi:hypothetical protein
MAVLRPKIAYLVSGMPTGGRNCNHAIYYPPCGGTERQDVTLYDRPLQIGRRLLPASKHATALWWKVIRLLGWNNYNSVHHNIRKNELDMKILINVGKNGLK